MFKEDLYEINNEIDKINQRIDSLCNAVNTNIASLQTIIDVMQDNDYVDSITPIVEGGETVGYEIVFTQSGSVKIYHGKKGETGHTPIVGVQQAEDGRWYWTIDGEWLLDGEGDKVLAEAIDGIDGEKGEEGITPKLEVRDNYWYISYDNGATWVQLGKATGENGKDGDSMFKSISYNDDYVELVLADGKTVIKIPTWASHMLLVDEIAKINSNISAIQAAIEALESNDYVQKVTPVKDEDGNVIGYTLQFAFTGDVTIFHGEDGKDGEDGEDGKDGVDGEDGKDGYTPVIGARQHPDGIWYWTVDGEWLLDTNGNRVKTTGDKGADGTIGITPELKIEDDYWYVSYDKGQTWTKLGKAKGEDGAAGSAGTAGDAFFKGVNVTEDYVTFTLADGTEIKIPTWKVYQELADAVAHLNTNVQSMQTIIAAIQNNDFVTGTTEIVDPQTNEVIGYKLHFSKSGDIEIYHGKTPNAPEIGIKKHPQYGLCWTYNNEYIKDPSTGAPVALPKDGASGVTPQFKIVDGFWFVSMDEGRTWQEAGQATGDQGETGATGGAGDSFFKSVKEEKVKDANGNDVVAYIVMTLADGSEYRVPTAYITDELTKRIAAIEGQFTVISTIVNALQNAEYIKEVVELYDGPTLVGYEITFVKYTIGTDGKLTETTRKSTIRNGGAGAAGTVVAAQYDEATDTWYWTLDGQPLKDKDGNYVAINGRPGQAGVTPKMQINKDTNEWEVSYDNGTTWTSTGVKATGPQGPQGNPGQGGTNGDSFFAGVSKDGDYWVFELVSGEKIMVPTAEAFASLAGRVAALEKSAESILSLVNGKKYIESCEPFSNDSGSGYHLVLVSLNAETGEATKEDCYIYNGIAGNTPVVGLRQDEATGDWYWTVDGEDLLVDGKPVKANGPQGIDGPVPSFRIDHENGHLYVTVNGEEEDLGRVVGTNGSAGEAGTDSSISVNTAEDGKVTITFIGGDGKTSTIEVPSWAVFVELQNAVNDIKSNVTALNSFVNGNSYITNYEPIVKDGKTVGFTADLVQYTIKQNEDGNWETSDPTTTPISFSYDCMVTVVNKGTETAPSWEWVVNGQETGIPMDGSDWVPSVVLHTDNNIYISKANGHDASTLEADLKKEDWQSYWIKIDTSKTTDTFATVTGNEDDGYTIEFPTGDKIKVPSYEQYTDLLNKVNAIKDNVDAINRFMNGQSYLTDYEEIEKGFTATLVEYTITTDENGNYVTSGTKETPITFQYDCMVSVADGEWVINGEPTGIPVDGRDWVPTILLHEGMVYVSTNTKRTSTLEDLKADIAAGKVEENWIVINPNDTDTKPGEDNNDFATVTGSEDEGWQITFPGENGQTIHVPSYKQYEDLLATVNTIKQNVTAIKDLINSQSYLTDYKEIKDGNKVVGFTANLVKYTITTDEKGNYVTSDAQKTPITFQYDCMVTVADGKWVINGEPTDIPVDGRDWVPTILLHEGMVYVSTNTEHTSTLEDLKADIAAGKVEENWIVINPNDTDTKPGEDNNDFATVTGSETDGWEITFPPVGDAKEGQTIHVPSYKQYEGLLKKVNAIKDNVDAINGFMSNYSFLTDYNETKVDNKVVGFTATLVKYTITTDENGTVTSSKTESDDITFQYDCMVTVADGKWVINGEPTDIPVDGRDWVPTILLHEGMVYVSTNTERTSTLEDLKKDIADDKVEENWIVINPNDTDTKPGEDNFATVTGSDKDGWTITFPPVGDAEKGQTIYIPSYVANPTIEFYSDSNRSTKITSAHSADGNGLTIYFKVNGSFVTPGPQMFAACEGNWSSSDLDWEVDDEKNVIGSVVVKPTTAYVGDNTAGKLTLYVPYNGATVIGQMTMTAEGAASLGVTNKEGNDTKVTIKIKTAEEPNGHLTVKAIYDSNEEDKIGWLSMDKDKPASKSDEGIITQELNLKPYILSAEEASNASPRSCTIAIYSPSGREVGRQQIVQNPIINLASKESANCYIISEPGRYIIPALKGNSDKSIWDDNRPENPAIKCDDSITDNTTNDVEYIGMLGDSIVFDVKNTEIKKENNGNTIIRIHDGSKTFWSWHLWFAGDSRPDADINLDRYPDNKGGVGYYVMNRALGAKSHTGWSIGNFDLGVWQDGLYYQWGRKDPLGINSISASSGASYANAVQNPTVFYNDWTAADADKGWTNKKSENDPCPPGYKVPSDDVWKDKNDDANKTLDIPLLGEYELTTLDRYTYNTTDPNSSNASVFIFYPYGGYYNSDGSKNNKVEQDVTILTDEGFVHGYNDDVKVGDRVLVSVLPLKFTDITFRYKSSTSHGAFWANDNSAVQYGYSGIEGEIEIVSLKYKSANVVTSGWLFPQIKSITWMTEFVHMEASEIPDFTDSEHWGLAINGLKDALVELVKSKMSSEEIYPYNKNADLLPANALQVRCVKEVNE